MSYQFGTELARFTLRIYLPGDELDTWDEPLTVALDAKTAKVLHDDKGELELYMELIPKQRPADQWEPQRFKVLKAMWLIELDYFSGGGLDYERREGDIQAYMDNWVEQAAADFQQRMKPVELLSKEPMIDGSWSIVLDNPVDRQRDPDERLARSTQSSTRRGIEAAVGSMRSSTWSWSSSARWPRSRLIVLDTGRKTEKMSRS